MGADVGFGLGASGRVSVSDSVTVGRTVRQGPTASFGVNGNLQVGRLAIGVSQTLVGPNGPGFGGVSAGRRGRGLSVNANVGGRVGGSFQIAPSC